MSWLRCELDWDKRHVASLHYVVCKKYKGSIKSLKSFSRVWITGLTSQKVSNLTDHATSEVHKVAMRRMRVECVKASDESVVLSSRIDHCISTLDEATRARMGVSLTCAL